MNTEIFKIGKKEGLFHLLFWGLFISSLSYAWSDNQLNSTIILSRVGMWVIAIVLPIYINALILIPKYLNKSNWLKYLIYVIGILIIAKIFHTVFLLLPWVVEGRSFNFISEFVRWFFRDFERLDRSLFSSSAMIVGVSFAYRIGKDWIVNEQEKEKLTSENLSMELALLKTQVNPHFLFNTLNNIYSIALEEKAVSTANNISKLGTLMRYSLHDAQAEFILLQKELEYIEQYLDMQKLRMSKDDKLKINIKLDDAKIHNKKIAPMILMPFIENAFKYGLSIAKESFISIRIHYSNDLLLLEVQNSIHTFKTSTSSGIGLANVKNRLRLIYPNHKLTYKKIDDVFNISLQIKL